MPVYKYQVRDAKDRSSSGTVAADSPRLAREQLRRQGLFVSQLEPISRDKTQGNVAFDSKSKPNAFRLPFSFAQRRLSTHVSWFTRELSTLLSVGTPMVDAIQIAIDQSRGAFRSLLLSVHEQINRGDSLGNALRSHQAVFGNILCEMVVVGEQSGSLQNVLLQAADFRDRGDRLKNRVLSAMLYPCLVLTVSTAVTVFLMTVVVPTLINSLNELGKELPLPTRILKTVSDLLLRHGVLIGGIALIVFVAFTSFVRSPAGRVKWDMLLLKIPVLGTLIVKQNCSRLCLVTGTLLRSGVEVVRALEIAEGAIANTAIRSGVAQARIKVSAGTELGSALQATNVLPPALVQVFALGQHTGQLEELLFRIAEVYDQQVNTLADRLTTIMEPLLIVALSVIVGFIMLATLLPILESGNVLSD